MRAVIQRVSAASVAVSGKQVAKIGPGLCVLVGVSSADTASEAAWLAKKLLSTRLWPDAETGKPWSVSLTDDPAKSCLLVSQFTLHGSVRRGTRPDFGKAMPGPAAQALFDGLVGRVREGLGDGRVQIGVFGAMMEVRKARRSRPARVRLVVALIHFLTLSLRPLRSPSPTTAPSP
jgi:D-tyrosyl-tRNA(Tyr) deacylase